MPTTHGKRCPCEGVVLYTDGSNLRETMLGHMKAGHHNCAAYMYKTLRGDELSSRIEGIQTDAMKDSRRIDTFYMVAAAKMGKVLELMKTKTSGPEISDVLASITEAQIEAHMSVIDSKIESYIEFEGKQQKAWENGLDRHKFGTAAYASFLRDSLETWDDAYRMLVEIDQYDFEKKRKAADVISAAIYFANAAVGKVAVNSKADLYINGVIAKLNDIRKGSFRATPSRYKGAVNVAGELCRKLETLPRF
jgi:hypothetical protein